jgi:hypothetical protein
MASLLRLCRELINKLARRRVSKGLAENTTRNTIEITGVGGINANLAPDAFIRWSGHYYQCKRDFSVSDRFSPVPFFLLCRSLELSMKSKHLNHMTQEQVKKKFGHNLVKAYNKLASTYKVLNSSEMRTLTIASNIYSQKGFEYFEPQDAATAYKRYPNLDMLDEIARKLLQQ